MARLRGSHGSSPTNDLAVDLGASDETIRRYIRPLVQRGMVLKVHGGIMLPDRAGELPFHNRMQENRPAKEKIAALTAQQISSGDSLILDGGTTTAYVALALTGHRDLQVVTNSTDIARTLAPHGNNRIHLAGGELRADDACTFGDPACDFVRNFHARHAILSIAAINAWGFLDQNPCEAEFGRSVMEQAERVIVVADHSKFGRDGFVKVADHNRIDVLMTDIDPPASLAKRLTDADIEVHVADPAGVRATG
jgi:DeoR family glycerol-3-phosphate regulon repressor